MKEQHEEDNDVDLARALLVDDETPFKEALSKRLLKRSLMVLTGTGGCEALDLDKLKTEP